MFCHSLSRELHICYPTTSYSKFRLFLDDTKRRWELTVWFLSKHADIYYYRTTHESGTYCETQYGNHAGMGKYLQPLTVQIKTCGLDPEM